MINYKKMLIAYMRHILTEEGITYLENAEVFGIQCNAFNDLTDAERDELDRMRSEVAA